MMNLLGMTGDESGEIHPQVFLGTKPTTADDRNECQAHGMVSHVIHTQA